MGIIALILGALALANPAAPSAADRAAFNVLKKSDRSIANVKIWKRVPVSDQLEMVLVLGTTDHFSVEFDEYAPWSGTQKLGLFLQEQAEPHRVFALAIQRGTDGCAARILRATATDVVISCDDFESIETQPNHKFVYDITARRLVSYFSYPPVRMYRVREKRGVQPGAAVTGANATQHLVVDFVADRVPEFRLLAATGDRPASLDQARRAARLAGILALPFGSTRAFKLTEVPNSRDQYSTDLAIEESVGNSTRIHRLPHATWAAFAGARTRRFADGYSAKYTRFDDQIGPWRVDGTTFWFGKEFYDGEGVSGLGGFGYFDEQQRQYRVITAPMIADWSVSAMFVEPEAVWLALASYGEGSSSSGGVVRFDRTAETFRHFEIGAGIGFQFTRIADRLLLATDVGITVIGSNAAKQYFVDRTTDGRYRVAESIK